MNVVARGGIASALSAMILERLTSYHLTVFMDIRVSKASFDAWLARIEEA